MLLENITSDANGLRIKFVGLKRVAEEEDREFLIPVTANGNLFVQVVLDHIAALKKSNIESGPIARRPAPRGSGFTIAPIGRNSFYALPKRIATVLQKKALTNSPGIHCEGRVQGLQQTVVLISRPLCVTLAGAVRIYRVITSIHHYTACRAWLQT